MTPELLKTAWQLARDQCSSSLKHNTMKNLLKLTDVKENQTILVGTESIISVELVKRVRPLKDVTKIQSRGAMIHTVYVMESVEEIYNLYNS